MILYIFSFHYEYKKINVKINQISLPSVLLRDGNFLKFFFHIFSPFASVNESFVLRWLCRRMFERCGFWGFVIGILCERNSGFSAFFLFIFSTIFCFIPFVFHSICVSFHLCFIPFVFHSICVSFHLCFIVVCHYHIFYCYFRKECSLLHLSLA